MITLSEDTINSYERIAKELLSNGAEHVLLHDLQHICYYARIGVQVKRIQEKTDHLMELTRQLNDAVQDE
jgi:hypothetical protein